MIGYLKEVLHKFQHPTPSRTQHSPHQWNLPTYGYKSPQLSHQAPDSLKISPPEANTVQKVVGTFLYYARAVNPKMLLALNSIVEEQSNITEATAKAVTQLFNYGYIFQRQYSKRLGYQFCYALFLGLVDKTGCALL